jgi:hypothetical protein
MTDAELLTAVDEAFAVTSRGLAPWPDPHEGRPPADDEYSRLTEPERFRLIGARAEAWIAVLTEHRLATLGDDVVWAGPAVTVVAHAVELAPPAADALPIVVARSRVGDIADAGITLGVGRPAVVLVWLPECGCDACDSGSQNELDELDRHILTIVAGRFRRLSSGERHLTILGDTGWSGHCMSSAEVRRVLVDPTGWEELTGAPWANPPWDAGPEHVTPLS